MTEHHGAELTFFNVGTPKFVVLSLCSFGIYPIYWTYQNWKHVRAAGRAISPFWRTFLAPFYAIALLQAIKRQAVREEIPVHWSPVALGGAFMILSLLALLPDPWWLLSLGVFAPLVPVLPTCREIDDAAERIEGHNELFSAANWALVIVGGLVLIVVVNDLVRR